MLQNPVRLRPVLFLEMRQLAVGGREREVRAYTRTLTHVESVVEPDRAGGSVEDGAEEEAVSAVLTAALLVEGGGGDGKGVVDVVDGGVGKEENARWRMRCGCRCGRGFRSRSCCGRG